MIVDEIQSVMKELKSKCIRATYLAASLNNIPLPTSVNFANQEHLGSGVNVINYAIQKFNVDLRVNVTMVAIFSGTGVDIDNLENDLSSNIVKIPTGRNDQMPVVNFDNFSDGTRNKSTLRNTFVTFCQASAATTPN